MTGMSLIIGQYRPLDSFLHRLDARAKLLPIFATMILGLISGSPWFYVSVLTLLLVALLLSGISVGVLWRSFRPVILLVVVTFLYHVIFSGGGSAVLLDLKLFAVTESGLQMATYFSLRLLLFVCVAFLITLTNSPSELAESLTRLLSPLRKFRVPVDDIGLIVFIAIRFIPILYEEFETIRTAQAIRGVDFGGSLINRAKKISFLLIPVLVAALARADDLAEAIQVRGYRSGVPRTCFSRSRFDVAAWLFMVLSTLAVVAIFGVFEWVI